MSRLIVLSKHKIDRYKEFWDFDEIIMDSIAEALENHSIYCDLTVSLTTQFLPL